MSIYCVIHGSYRKYPSEINAIRKCFIQSGIEVICPSSPIQISTEKNGFVFFSGQENQDYRQIELEFLHKVCLLGHNGFSFFYNPTGTLGANCSFELGIVKTKGIQHFFEQPLQDPSAFDGLNLFGYQQLANYVKKYNQLPNNREYDISKLEKEIFWQKQMVAVGAIIEYTPNRPGGQRRILLVRTHQWNNKFSLVGERVFGDDDINKTLISGIKQETSLSGSIICQICTFNQLTPSSHRPHIKYLFIDSLVRVDSQKVILNEEAEGFLWLPPKKALKLLDIEPNARRTINQYIKSFAL